jgi:hypothetical protein
MFFPKMFPDLSGHGKIVSEHVQAQLFSKIVSDQRSGQEDQLRHREQQVIDREGRLVAQEDQNCFLLFVECVLL